MAPLDSAVLDSVGAATWVIQLRTTPVSAVISAKHITRSREETGDAITCSGDVDACPRRAVLTRATSGGAERIVDKAHIIVLPGGGYAEYSPHEGEPVANWLRDCGVSASVFPYPLHERHPAPLEALQEEISLCRGSGATRIGLMGFSAGGHLAGLAALSSRATPQQRVQFAILGYSITSMQTEAYRPSRLILLGADAPPELRRATSEFFKVDEARTS